ncbi:MAG: hypothetical protein QG597_2385 [Actinomycetota bacterium]|nr:hypothetical protein [Actinomycetota bacterium]
MSDPASCAARIISHGRITWAELLVLAEGLTCAWADHDDWQTGPCPDTAPAYTHLWGWSPDRLLRVRIDEADAVVAELTPDGASGQEVPVRVVRPEKPEPWARSRIGDDLVLVRTETNAPIGFAAFGPAAQAWTTHAAGRTS